MRSTPIEKLVTCLLLLIILASYGVCPVMCIGESAADFDRQVNSLSHAADHDGPSHGPDGLAPDEHDHVCIGCPSHAPLPSLFTPPVYSPAVAFLTVSEPLCTLPEVYLSRFIPPQLHA